MPISFFNTNDTELANNIVNIALNCKNHGVSKFSKKKSAIKSCYSMSQGELCEIGGFIFINNDMITTDHPWRDGIYFQHIGTNVLSRIFYQILNNFLFEDHSWLQNLDQTNEFVFDSDLKGLSKLTKGNYSIIGYLNISISKIDILCIDETKLDTSFSDSQFKIVGYQFPLFRKDWGSKVGC